MFGDFGGLLEVITLVATFFLAPIAEHQFTLKAIQKLYLARTKDKNLFEEPAGKKSKYKQRKKVDLVKSMTREDNKVIRGNRPAKVSVWQSARLFFKNKISCITSCCCDPTADDKLYRLLEEGGERIEKELDIVRMIK